MSLALDLRSAGDELERRLAGEPAAAPMAGAAAIARPKPPEELFRQPRQSRPAREIARPGELPEHLAALVEQSRGPRPGPKTAEDRLADAGKELQRRQRERLLSSFARPGVASAATGELLSGGIDLDAIPATERLLSRPEWAPAVVDLEAMGGLERWLHDVGAELGPQFKAGLDTDAMGRLAYKEMLGEALSAEDLRILEAGLGADLATTTPGAAANLLGSMLPMIGSSLKGALAGGSAGAALGFGATLAVGGVGAVPGATFGASAGALGGSLFHSYQVNSGHAWAEYGEFRTADGQGLDLTVRKGGAMLAGVLAAGLDSFGLGYLASKFPGLDKLTGDGARALVRRLLEQPSMHQALSRFAKAYAGGIFVETGTEVLQETVQMAVGELLKTMGEGEFASLTAEEITERLGTTAAHTARGMALLGIPGPAMSFAVDARAAIRAGREREAYLEFGELARRSQLKGDDPAAFGRFVAELQSETGAAVQDVLVDAQAFATFFQSQGADPALAAAELGVAEQWTRATELGGDLAVPLDAWARRIAGTDAHAALADHVRLTPDAMTAAQARTFAQEIEQLAEAAGGAEAEGSPRATIRAEAEARLAEGGLEPEAARANAELWANLFTVMGERAGVDPVELWRRQGPEVQRAREVAVETVAAAARTGPAHEAGGGASDGNPAPATRVDGESPPPNADAPNPVDTSPAAYRLHLIEEARASYEQEAGGLADALAKSEALQASPEWAGMSEAQRLTVHAAETGHHSPADLAQSVALNRERLADPQQSFRDRSDEDLAFGSRFQEWQLQHEAAGREFFQSVPTPDWFGDWLGVGGGRVSVNADGLFRKYQRRAGEAGNMRFDSAAEIQAFVEETLANAHIAIEASRDEAVLVARIGEREQAVVVEDKGERGGVVISAFVPDAGQLDAKVAKVVEEARRRDAVPAILVSPLAAADADTRLLVSRWLPLSSDRVQPGKYDLSTGKFLGNRTLFQNGKKAPKGTTKPSSVNRGAITFVPGKRPLIRLFEKADLSTVLHETGHLFLEMLGDLAAGQDAPQALKSDYAAVLAWLGVEDRSQIGVEQHEQLARGFEAWLMEGKAPSLELRSVFQRFRSWLSLIYRSVKRLNVELTDDVRQVFDRMVATDDAIAGAEAAMKFDPLFKDAVDGISDGERRAALDQAERATLEATREVEDQQRQALARERSRQFKEVFERHREVIRKEVEQLPAFRAMAFFGKGLLDGERAPDTLQEIKLDRDAVRSEYGKAKLAALDARRGEGRLTGKGGITPDQAAELLGFSSGDALIQAMIDAPDRATLIHDRALQRTRDELRTVLQDAPLQAVAREAVANDERAVFLSAESRLLAKANGTTAMPLQVVRAAAAKAVAQMSVRELFSHDRHLYTSQTFAKQAQAAFKKGDLAAAQDAKNKQLLHFEMWRIAKKERDKAEKSIEKWKRISRGPVKNLPAGHRDQILTLLERFELKKLSGKEVERRRSLADWIKAQEQNGLQVDIPEHLQSEAMRRHYTELAVQDFMALRDAIAHIEHLGKLEGKLLANERHADLESAADAVVRSVFDNNEWQPLAPDFGPDRLKDVRQAFKGFMAAHSKVEFLFERLDGFKLGSVWDTLFRPLAEAQGKEQERQGQISKELRRIFSAYSIKERHRLHRQKLDVPELGTSFTKSSLLSLALNWGNEGNRLAVMKGYGWDQPTVEKALDRLLDQREWQVVQQVWDLIDGFWPEISALQAELTGATPPKVEPLKIKTRFGDVRGGYYPLVYDSDLSFKAFQREEALAASDLFGGNHTRAATRKGHTIARVGSGGQPPRLDLSVLPKHLSHVVHDLTHRKPVIDIGRLLARDDVREAIERTAGREVYRLLRPWLANVAAPAYDPGAGIDAFLSRARVGTSIASMGLKTTTALAQPLGFLSSIYLLGPKWALIGLKDVYKAGPKSIIDAKNFAFSRSLELKNRAKSFDRDVNDTIRRMTRVGGPLAGWESAWFWHIGFLDMAVSLPTWHGAYQKALAADPANEAGAIAAADAAVRMTQSGGGAKDLARIQRGSEGVRMFTLFYSWFSALYNQFERSVRSTDFKRPSNYPQFVGAMAMLWFAPAVLGEMVGGRLPDEDEDLAIWAGKTLLAYPSAAVVGLRDVVGAATSDFGFQLSPITDAFGGIAKAGRDAVTGNFDNRSAVQSAFITVAIWGHLPGRQMWITGEFFWDWLVNDAEPESLGEALRHALLQRRPADERP